MLQPRSLRERVLFIALSTAAMYLGSCPASWAGQPAAVDALNRGSLRLIGRFAAGHACAIEPRVALTNGHVIDMRPFDNDVRPFPFAWSDGTGASGFLVPSELERARDLARVQPLREGDVFPHPLRVAAEAPKPGDRIWFLGYSWKNRKSAMDDDVIEARVTRVVALHVIFTPSGQPGSSGSCVVNDAGEVVAINEGAYETGGREEAGVAVGVWGGLAKMPE
jgi:hypothetical protein